MGLASGKLNLSENALTVLKERYLLRGSKGQLLETESQLLQRTAQHVASAEQTYGGDSQAVGDLFLQAMVALDFLPNSPTLMNAGTPLGQLAACFVLPIEDSVESIFKALEHAAQIQGSGGGVGFAFSKIRPQGDEVRSTGGIATGPLPFLHVFNAATECIKQSGKRRGANMGILRVDHPDIERFIDAKKDPAVLTNFNISVGITDSFMEALASDGDLDLINPRTEEVEKAVGARQLFDKIVNMAWATGDPGMIFLDHINRNNPTPRLGMIEGTNPCGETPLLPYESCVLGSVNLSNMVQKGQVEWKKLAETVSLAVRFLDDVVDVNRHPLPEIEQMALTNRKIGLGVMGWADMLIKLDIPYGSDRAVSAAEEIMEFISFHARSASIQLACERGPFLEFEHSTYSLDPDHIARVDMRSKAIFPERPSLDWPALADQLRQYGIRNATVTTIAPTGSISTIAGVSSGIEPLYALARVRRIVDQEMYEISPLFEEFVSQRGMESEIVLRQVREQGTLQGMHAIPEHIRQLFVTAHELEAEWHVRMQAAFQKHVDNAVSKTVNLRHSATPEDVAKAYLLAYQLGCKGITVYRDGSRSHQVLTAGIRPDAQLTPRPQAIPKGLIPAKSESVDTPSGKMTLFIREVNGKPFDAFVVLGRSGADITAFTEAIGRLLSVSLRSGIAVDILAENLEGLGGRTTVGFGPTKYLSVPDAIGKILRREYVDTPRSLRRGDLCPDCKNTSLQYTEGCLKCPICGFAEC